MIELQFKCVKCGKEWSHHVDEHDGKRYFHIGEEPPHRETSCGCVNRNVQEFPHPVMDAVCNCCNE